MILWQRKAWTVVITPTRMPGFAPSTAWGGADDGRSVPDSEPTRAMLFTTRRQARDWARDCKADMRAHQGWRFRVARVVETVSEVAT